MGSASACAGTGEFGFARKVLSSFWEVGFSSVKSGLSWRYFPVRRLLAWTFFLLLVSQQDQHEALQGVWRQRRVQVSVAPQESPFQRLGSGVWFGQIGIELALLFC
jgi:hypothetical protein